MEWCKHRDPFSPGIYATKFKANNEEYFGIAYFDGQIWKNFINDQIESPLEWFQIEIGKDYCGMD